METIMNIEELHDWLESQGFKFSKSKQSGDQCNWIAFRRSEISARKCECEKRKKMDIVIRPFYDSSLYQNGIDVELLGEYRETWFKIQATDINFTDLQKNLPTIEKQLIAAWNALSCIE